MKKITISSLLILASIQAGICQEPIDRNIEGIKLAKTLKVQAIRILKEKGYNVGTKAMGFREHPEEQPIMLNDTTEHLGHIWEEEVLNTTANKTVYRFCFLQENKEENHINKEYTECKELLDKKYKNYTTESTEYFTNYSDEQTEISLWKTTSTSLRLCYQALTFDDEE